MQRQAFRTGSERQLRSTDRSPGRPGTADAPRAAESKLVRALAALAAVQADAVGMPVKVTRTVSATEDGSGRRVLSAGVTDRSGSKVGALALTVPDGARPRSFATALTLAAREVSRHPQRPAPTAVRTSPAGPVVGTVLARGVGILDLFEPDEPAVRRRNRVTRSALPRSTACRCVEALLEVSALEPHGDLVCLGPLLRRLAPAATAAVLPDPQQFVGLIDAEETCCWFTPVDPRTGIALNSLVVRPAWTSTDPATLVAHSRLDVGPLRATTVRTRLGELPGLPKERCGVPLHVLECCLWEQEVVQALGLELSGAVCAAVLWSEPDQPPHAQDLLEFGAVLVDALGGSAPLTVVNRVDKALRLLGRPDIDDFELPPALEVVSCTLGRGDRMARTDTVGGLRDNHLAGAS